MLTEPDDSDDGRAFADGDILRGMTVEDDLLEARLEKHRHEAYEACAALLAEHKLPAVLVDVEHLFDGQGLFFYFLGEVPAAIEDLHRPARGGLRDQGPIPQVHRNAHRRLRPRLRHGRSQRPRRLRIVYVLRRGQRLRHETQLANGTPSNVSRKGAKAQRIEKTILNRRQH